MPSAADNADDCFPLTPAHRMLLQMRDTLYEGNWDDFITDLEAHAKGHAHVFDIVPPSPAAKTTIADHLSLIDQMRRWETDHSRQLRDE